MKDMKAIVAKLNGMTESERKEYIFNELTLDEIYELYDEYGFATELENGTVKASYVERNADSKTESNTDKMDRIRDLLCTMGPLDRRDYINDVLSVEEAYILHDVYGFDINFDNGRVSEVFFENGYEDDEYYYRT